MIMEHNFNDNLHIDSVRYREKINKLVTEFGLFRKTEITNFCICICFKDGAKYFLSNMPDWAIDYHKLGGIRCDEVFDLNKMIGLDHFFPRTSYYDALQILLVNREEQQYGYYDTYSLIRHCTDCTFILLSLHDNPIADKQKCYLKTRAIFEDFCVFFIINMVDIIKTKNKKKKELKIFNDFIYLSKTIKKQYFNIGIKFTEREQQCIRLLKSGYSIKLIAKSLGLSEKTIKKYVEIIREKMNVSSTVALIEAITNIINI